MIQILREIEPYISPKGKKSRKVECECKCGNIFEAHLHHIKSKQTKSCGCEKGNKKHLMKNTTIYNVWINLRQRCDNQNNNRYSDRGGRGIKYDPRWEQFEVFYEEMGPTYKEGLTLDRIYNDCGYSKENCRWSTPKEQARNKRINRIYKGKCISDWCEELGLNYNTVRSRINKLGWPIEKALFSKKTRLCLK